MFLCYAWMSMVSRSVGPAAMQKRCFAENPRFTYYVDIFFTVVARFNWKNYYAFKTESLDRFGSKGLFDLSGVDAFLVKNKFSNVRYSETKKREVNLCRQRKILEVKLCFPWSRK